MEFSPEDASRTELEFLAQVVEAAIDAGASTVNIPDTVGYTVPDEFAELFRYLRKNVRGIEQGAPVGALPRRSRHGRRQQPDGRGRRRAPGRVHHQRHRRARRQLLARGSGDGAEDARGVLQRRAPTSRPRRLYPTSRLVSSITGMPIPRNKAVVGENAFAHEAGIHQHGMLKHHSTYEILRPEDVGLSRSHLVLGKHSGRHAFRDRVKELGFELDELEFNRVFEEFKALADKKKELFDGDIEALVLRAEGSATGPWTPRRV